MSCEACKESRHDSGLDHCDWHRGYMQGVEDAQNLNPEEIERVANLLFGKLSSKKEH